MVYRTTKQKTMKKFIIGFIALAILGGVVKSCTTTSAEETTESGVKSETKSEETQNTWKYDSSKTDMGDKYLYAEVDANEKVYMDFPYNGGSTGTLLIRNKNGKKEAMFLIDKGQIDTDYDGTYVRVKFDNQPPQKWSMSGSSDNSSDVLFFENVSTFIKKVKESKKVVLEVPFFQNGNQEFVFNTENLKF